MNSDKVTALTIPAAMRDLRIEGSASRLLFTRNSRSELSGSIPLINVQGCTRCEIRNLTIDWDWDKWRIASLAKLPIGGVSGTSTEISWAFQILAPPMLANGLETESLYAVQSIHPVDPATFSVGVFGHKEFYLVNASFGFATSRRGGSGALLPDAGDLPPDVLDNPNAKIITTTSINITSPNSPTGLTPNYITTNPKITITFPRAGNPYGAQIGANKGHEIYWLIKHLTNEVPAFRLAGCTNFFLSAVHIRSAPGRAVEISRGCSNLVFDGLTVDEVTKRSVNMTRPLSVAGGGIHAPMGVENLLVQNAQFGFLGGDAINIAVPTAMQGFGYANKSGSNPNKTDPDYQRLLVPRAQSSRISFEMGDMVTFYNNSNLSPLSGHIADVSRKLTGAWPNAPLNGGTWFLNLDQTVPLSLFPYKFNHPQLLGLTNSAISAHNVVLRNVNSRYHRGRGIVVSAQLNVLLEKSSFSNLALAGLMIRSSAYTQVGVGTKNVVVANNFFSRCSIMSNESAVTIDAVNKEQVVIQNWRLNGNVNITGNTFERVSKWVAAIAIGFVHWNRLTCIPTASQ